MIYYINIIIWEFQFWTLTATFKKKKNPSVPLLGAHVLLSVMCTIVWEPVNEAAEYIAVSSPFLGHRESHCSRKTLHPSETYPAHLSDSRRRGSVDCVGRHRQLACLETSWSSHGQVALIRKQYSSRVISQHPRWHASLNGWRQQIKILPEKRNKLTFTDKPCQQHLPVTRDN